jgi:hypothetical protein
MGIISTSMFVVAWVPFVSTMVGSTCVLSIPLYNHNPYDGSSELLEHNLVGSSLSIQIGVVHASLGQKVTPLGDPDWWVTSETTQKAQTTLQTPSPWWQSRLSLHQHGFDESTPPEGQAA